MPSLHDLSRKPRLGLIAFALGIAATACSDSAERTETATETPECEGAADATPCEREGFICVQEACAASFCGDGVTDTAGGEACDDARNGDNTDGCTDECRRSCEQASDCLDDDPCNGEERCDSATHQCEPGTPPCDDDNPCTTDTCKADGSCEREALAEGTSCGDERICVESSCDSAGCGNGYLESALDEACDDGKNGDDTDGCTDECEYSCASDEDCVIESICTGKQRCDPEAHHCVPGEPLCDDGNDCTANVCDPGTGCSFPPLDEDGDKFAPGECTEIPAGLLGGGDCADDNPDVNPTGTFSETAYGPLNNLWDYNCDGRFERRWTLEAAVGLCESAWLYGRVATCGEEGRMKVFQEGACIVLSSEAKRIQQCR